MIIGSPHINPTVTHPTRKQACHLQSECEEGRKPSNSTDDYLDMDWFISDHKTVYCSVLLLDISAANLISFNCSAFVPSIKPYTSVGHQDNMNKREKKKFLHPMESLKQYSTHFWYLQQESRNRASLHG